MNLRDALTQQAPSLALQRAATDEIARLDAELIRARDMHRDAVVKHEVTRRALQAAADAMVPASLRNPTDMARLGDPWPQVGRALWPDA
ncbi:hypothetical protein [Aquariibacter albus]|uniref:Uncharacterized protein n=1 Tax=Aquariibacter albus TaxID=2759899 RepID=A0A839HH84_9BURK|nr:hypothetical protein [Aquariibacter albus]MBB1161505.1 hypothetical protein [Aquariibacter albus]